MSGPGTPYLIAISGGSCSGKSYVTQRVADTARHTFNPDITDSDTDNNISKLHQDSYYKGGNSETNFDEPGAVDWDLLVHHITELKNGNSIEVPLYSFETHSRLNKTEKIYPSKVIIIEGTMILSNKCITELCNLKIFVSAYPELMYARRLKRDVEERGRDIEEVNERYFRDVIPGTIMYTDTGKQYADIILLNNSHHKFVGLEILLDHIEKKLKQ